MYRTNAAVLIVSGMSTELNFLPFLGVDGYVIQGWSHILVGYPRCGKTELATQLALEWVKQGKHVLYISEESEALWCVRFGELEKSGLLQGLTKGGQPDLERFELIFGLGEQPDGLLKEAYSKPVDVVIVDTIRSLLDIEDENDNSEIRRRIKPWTLAQQQARNTLILCHHSRKGGGSHGEAISGGHALLGACDMALEITFEQSQQARRTIIPYGRVISSPSLLYELNGGKLSQLGDPDKLRLKFVEQRICMELDGVWCTTRQIKDRFTKPKPSDSSFDRAFTNLAVAGTLERQPPWGQDASRKTVRWRLSESFESV